MTNSYNNRLRTALSLAQPTGAWTNGFAYDAAKRLTNVTSPAGAFSYGHAPASSYLLTSISLPNGSYITNAYDSVARLLFTKLNNSSHTTLDSAEYGYNAGNQRTTFTNAAGTYVQYTNDPIGQLKIANSSVNSEDRGYTYDAAWNLNYRTNNGVLTSYTLDSKNEVTSSGLFVNYQYDTNGNLTFNQTGSHSSQGYSYDDENRLVNWYSYDDKFDGHGVPASAADLRTEFVYDGTGRLRNRIEYTSDGSVWIVSTETRYVYDGWRVIQERDTNNTPTVSYTRGTDLSGSLEGAGGIGGLLSRTANSQLPSTNAHAFYHADGNGNVTYLVNSGQTLAASYRYDPYGNTLSSSGTLASANVYRFSSKELHVNSGLYYYGERFYSPNLQRWLNRDPLGEPGFEQLRRGASDVTGDGPNLYTFVWNSPISSMDLFGLAIWKCSRQTGWNVRGLQHAYLWDDRPGTKGPRSCGRDGAGVPGFGKAKGVSSRLDKGPGVDKCVEIPNSDGNEDAVMASCRKPRYKPFPFSDCHDWVGNSLKENHLDDPYIYGRFKTIFDAYADRLKAELDY